jgi:plastocyanin
MRSFGWIAMAGLCACSLFAQSQPAPVSVVVMVVNPKTEKKALTAASVPDLSNIAVWLTPVGASAGSAAATSSGRPLPQVTQSNKSFAPRVLVVQAGTAVQFPNKDPFLHNVFSLFDGKRFDLGFYEAGSSKTVHFDRAGVSFLFCNIHPEMSGAVIAVDTPYFGLSDPHRPRGNSQRA